MQPRPRFARFLVSLSSLLVLLSGANLRADPVITEFMASNTTTLADEDGAFPDWIEIFNPDATAVNLRGWYLTDDARDKKRWSFPTVTLAPQAYLVVFASGKDRRDPAKRLHTDFSLNADGEYLALIKPDGVTAATEFAPAFPEQRPNVSYGTGLPGTGGTSATYYLQTPTPGATNTAVQNAPLTETVKF
jgi:hypothetical protein